MATSTNRVNTIILTKIHKLIRSDATTFLSKDSNNQRELQRLWSGSQVFGTFLLLAKRALNEWLQGGGNDGDGRCFRCFSCMFDSGWWSTRATPIVALLSPETRRVITAINRRSRASMESGNGILKWRDRGWNPAAYFVTMVFSDYLERGKSLPMKEKSYGFVWQFSIEG